jgi:hypothetical protein
VSSSDNKKSKKARNAEIRLIICVSLSLSEAVLVQATKAYKGSGGIWVPHGGVWSTSRPGHLTLGKHHSWVGPRVVLNILEKEKSLDHTRTRTPTSSARSIITTPITLFRLLMSQCHNIYPFICYTQKFSLWNFRGL